jgi:hypothetical protein
METVYYSLASKTSFNKALRHFYKVTDAVDEIDSRVNIADYINELIDDEDIHQDQILPIIGAVLRDKFEYSHGSFSIPASVSDFEKLVSETAKWTALEITIVYFAPDGKRFVINPKNPDSWDRVREVFKDQLIVIYAKYLKDEDKKIEQSAIQTLKEMISGKDVFVHKEFIDHTVVQRAPEPAKSPERRASDHTSSKKRSITPKYGVQVSNELFHNGNVEAWKKIVESYHTKFSDLTVHIMFEGEVINDINSLFKWGKVKHGDTIFFQVSGEEILGVSKLQKYLYEGASPRFEQFLKLGIGRVLNLF